MISWMTFHKTTKTNLIRLKTLPPLGLDSIPYAVSLMQYPLCTYVLIDFSLTVSAATLMFTPGRGSAISSVK